MRVSNNRRRRGAILTEIGDRKLQAARQAAERVQNFGDRYTNEELAELTGLSLKTIAKIFGLVSATTAVKTPVDRQSLNRCFTVFELSLERTDYVYPGEFEPSSSATEPVATRNTPSQACETDRNIDCGEAPDVSIFYGREQELVQLQKWVERDCCRVVAILGMGGIGKTALATKLAQQIQSQFTAIAWRSLCHAPLPTDLFPKLIEIFSRHTEVVPPTMTISAQISCLLHYFRQERCLLILDNAEAILPSAHGDRPEYAAYDELLRRLGESSHQSCLLLTSREKPAALVSLEGQQLPVRTFGLRGFTERESEHLFNAKGLSTSSAGRSRLVSNYSGNPLALNIVATSISDLFGGDIDEFLDTEVIIFNDIRQLLDRQIAKLSRAEQAVMYWLAIERTAVSPSNLHAQIVPATTRPRLLATIEALGRRSLLEHSGGKFTQQAVVMEYMTARFIDRVCREIAEWNLDAERPSHLPSWLSYPWMKSQSPEYIHAIQTRLILKPIAEQLQLQFGNKSTLVRRLREILASLQRHYHQIVHYGGGNLFNLLRYLQVDLHGYNFVDLPMWQADLQGAILHNVDFSRADFSRSQFTQNFGGIFALAIGPDNRLVVTGEYSGNLLVWHIDNKQLQRKLVGHTNWIWAVAFSPDGRTIASASQDGTVRLWDATTGECDRVLSVDSYHVLSLSFRPQTANGAIVLATAHGDGKVRLWQVTTGAIIRTIEAHAKQVFSVRFSPDGRSIATSSDDLTVKIWDATTGECLRTLTAYTKRVWSVRFSPDGRLLATCSGDGTIALWDVETWKVLHVLTGYRDWIFAVCFSPDSKMLATGSKDRVVKIWDLETNQKICTLRGHQTWVATIQFSPDGNLLITGSGDRSVRLWDRQTWQELYHWQGYTNWVESVAFAPTGNQLVSGGQDGIAKIWDVLTGQIIQTFTGHQQGLWSVDYSPDGKLLASGSADSTVKLWDVESGELLHTFCAEQGDVWRVKFSPDGRSIAGIGRDNILVYIWLLTGELATTLIGHTNVVRAIAFSPDSRLLATGSFDSYWRLWDVATSQLLGCYPGHLNWVWDVAFSPDGKLLASCSADRTARLWDVATGECLRILEGHTQEVVATRFSPNGCELATSSGDHTIKIWEVETGQLLQTLSAHRDRVLSIAYSPDGRWLASGSADETIEFWDLATGACFRTCKPPAPYLGMNITGVTGLTAAAIESLKTLGAIDRAEL